MDGVVARVKALPWARMLLLAALAVTLVYWTLVVIQSVGMVSPRGSDFAFYELAATALRFDPHANIYSAQTLANTLQAHGGCFPFQHAPYTYPPLLAILPEPLAGSSCATATTVWDLVNVVFWLLATALLIDLLRRRWPGRQLLATALVVAASFASWHMMWGFWLGQVHIITLCGIALSYWLLQRRRPMLAGAALVFVTLIELHPAVLLAYFVLRGRGDDGLEYAWAICTMLAISPLVWAFYLVWLLPAVVICLGASRPTIWRVAPLLILYSLTAFPLGMALRPPATLLLWLISGALFARSMLPGRQQVEAHAEPVPALAQILAN